MNERRGNGYYGYSMSHNAINAYSDGEKPYSKWSKVDIIDELESNEIDKDIINNLKKLTLKELKDKLLRYSSWHHTSSRFNRTDFYSVDIDKAEELNVDNIIKSRPKKEKKVVEKPTYISALVEYDEWAGSRRYGKMVTKRDYVEYMSNEKMISCYNSNNYKKRLSSLKIIASIEQKTKFADKKRVERKAGSNR